jgi:hydrogenase maturation protease
VTNAARRVARDPRVLVVGLGSVDRGDDAIGPMVATRVDEVVTARGLSGVRVIVHEDPTALVEQMADCDVAVIVDATRSSAPSGTVTLREVGRTEPAISARTTTGPAGTHGLGLASAIELARALDRLPERVVVVGIEATGFEHGQGLSAPVRDAVPGAVDVILEILVASGRNSDRGASITAS